MPEMATPGELEQFFRGLESGLKCFDEIRQIYNEQMAFDFNVLNIFYPNENKVSEILAFFFDPEEMHGQKDKFLRLFLTMHAKKVLSSYRSGTTRVKVKTEKHTDANRRIDIVVYVGDWIIAIENKIWNAPDQEKQIEDYVKYLDDKKPDKFILFYLTPNGRDPSEPSIAPELCQELKEKNHLIPLCQDDLIKLFRAFEKVCLAEKVKVFIRNFIAHLEGKTIMGEEKFITDFVMKKENMALALKIIFSGAADTIKDAILKSIEKKIKNRAKALALDYMWWEHDAKYAEIMIFTFNKWETETYVFIGFENTGWNKCYYGISRKGDQEFLAAMKEKYNFGYICEENCNSYYDKYFDWRGLQPWLDMIDKDGKNKFLDDLFEKLKGIKNVADAVADDLEKEKDSNWHR